MISFNPVAYVATLPKEKKFEPTLARTILNYPLYYMTLSFSQRLLDKKFKAAVISGNLKEAKTWIEKGSVYFLDKDDFLTLAKEDNKKFIDIINFLMAQISSFRILKDRTSYFTTSVKYYYEDIAARGISEVFHYLTNEKNEKALLIHKIYERYKGNLDPFELQIKQ